MGQRAAARAAGWSGSSRYRPRGRALLAILGRRALLLLGALGLAAAVGFLVAYGFVEAAVGLAVALPVVALIMHNPFNAVLLWALVMPFFVQSTTADTGPVNWALHRLMPPATLILLLVYDSLGLRRMQFRFGLIDVAMLAFLGIGVLNILFTAVNTQREVMSFYDKIAVPFLFFWIIRAVRPTRADLKRLVAVGLFTIGFQFAVGLLSWAAPGALPPQWVGRAGERTTGTFGGPAPYTITLVFYALLALHDGLMSRAAVRRILVFGFVALALIAVFLSLSRGSWLGAAVAFGGLVVLYPRAVPLVGLAGLVVAGALAFGPLGEQVSFAQQRIEDEGTVANRIITNDASMRMIADRPLTGFGFGNFERFDEAFKERAGDIPLKLGGSSHNTYLNLAAELGLVATALYFVPPALLFVQSLRERRRIMALAPALGALGVVLWLALLDQFIVSNFLEMIHAYPWGTTLWWISLALIATLLERVRSDQAKVLERWNANQ